MTTQTNPNHEPPDLVHSENPKELYGWTRICDLIAKRWPKWEPTGQDLKDWRHLLSPLTFDWLDEALLKVRAAYASDVPKLKWVLAAYYRVRDEQRQVSVPNREQEQLDAELELKQSVLNDREECERAIGELSGDKFKSLLLIARSRFPFLPKDGEGIDEIGHVTKFAIKFLLEENPAT